MKQIIVKKGKSIIEQMPKPTIYLGTVLVKTHYSCISQGTEIAGIENSGQSKLEKITSIIRNKPQAIQMALETYKDKGLKSVYKLYKSKTTDKPRSTGYSIAGIVEGVGAGIDDIKTGDLVACAGAGIANHAEYVVVPRNLVIKVPEGLNLKLASTVTLGGIAMQGVRRGDFKLGEFVVVIGLGFIGQLSVQMIKASGCRVIALDIDKRRCEVAKKHAAEFILNPRDYKEIEQKIYQITNGFGADGVIFAAATNDPTVISNAFKMCKKKGKVVLVGVAGDKINRNDLYKKELDFLISTSYGPGRYDEEYEQKGIDYPYAYVRWTENRNMQEYLRLLKENIIKIDDQIEKVYQIEKAEEAFKELMEADKKPIIALFKYSQENNENVHSLEICPKQITDKKILNIALIGAGNFAKSIHLPNLMKLTDKYNLYAICDLDPLNAKTTAETFNANIAFTDYREVLNDDNVDMVMICTRHNLHAKLSIEALNAGKAVFVEKPMATNTEELDKLIEVIKKSQLPFMVGFNRRFSPFAKKIKEKIKNSTNPLMMSYHMNAGYIPLESWAHEYGGRIIGEGCHIIDLFSYFTESEIVSISADKIEPKTKAISSVDNVSINIKYSDGSVANLIYTALGNKKYPKENLEIFCDNNVIKMTDYKMLESFGDYKINEELKEQDKGHLQELIEFYDSISVSDLPIRLDSMKHTSYVTFLINEL